MIEVKICGITNLEDALLSIEYGADSLGFNFYKKSPRYITPEKAKAIIVKLPENNSRIGVFVNESLETVIKIASELELNGIQLHGGESSDFVNEFRRQSSLKIIKAFRVSNDFVPRDVLSYAVDAILLDTKAGDEYGGTGQIFDWQIARQVKKLFENIYLAGGLSPENVVEAIHAVKPFAVDACSSLEKSPGVKDQHKLRRFIANAKSV